MSLLLELEIPGLDWDLAEKLERETKREGMLQVYGNRRRRWLRTRPSVGIEEELDDGTSVFSQYWTDDPEIASDADIVPSCRDKLAATLEYLGETLAPGWRFHAGWIGDAEREVAITSVELADLARESKLDDLVTYRVVAAD